MAQGGTPVVQQRRLRAELRRARDAAGRTQKDVAGALGWSTSKVIRIETGAVAVSTSDVMALLHYYGIKDDRAEELLAVTRAKEEMWWDKYAYFGQAFLNMLSYETSASHIRQFQNLVVPGLLQTREYAQAVMEAYTPDSKMVADGMTVRMRRQDLLTEDGPEYTVVLDESVVRRRVKDTRVQLDQLVKLRKQAGHPRISIQVVPFTAGVVAAMRVSFAIFEFPSDEEDHVVNIEHPHQMALIRDDAEVASDYLESFSDLQDIALSTEESAKFLDTLIDELEREV